MIREFFLVLCVLLFFIAYSIFIYESGKLVGFIEASVIYEEMFE